MARVIYSPEAESDLLGIASFIARDKPSAARQWVKLLQDKCELLATHPRVGEEKPGFGVQGCRVFSVGSYVIFFRAVEQGIEVARIVHGSRDMGNL